MTLWWIGNAVVVVVVLPLVALLLHRLHTQVIEIRRYADDTLEHGVLAIAELDAVDELIATREHVALLKQQVSAYGGSIARILS